MLTYNQLLGLGNAVRYLITFRGQNGITRTDIVGDASWPTLLCDDIFSRLVERNLKGKFRRLLESFGFLVYFPKVLAIARENPTSPIFAPIGSSASLLWRVLLLKLFTRNRMWLYFVDDIEFISKRLARPFELACAKLLLPAAIKSADRVFVISEGLGKAYLDRHGVSHRLILPCFRTIVPPPRKHEKDSKEFIFVFSGGLSFLYNDTLLLFQSAIRKFNLTQPPRGCRLIIQTYSPKSQFLSIGFDETVTEYRTSESRGDFLSYREADCFLIPYSFDPEATVMVSTSFPQKVAELLQMSRSILFFGPTYSSVISFFQKAGLPHVVDSSEPHAIGKAIRVLTSAPPENALLDRYAALHRAHFSPEATASVLVSEKGFTHPFGVPHRERAVGDRND